MEHLHNMDLVNGDSEWMSRVLRLTRQSTHNRSLWRRNGDSWNDNLLTKCGLFGFVWSSTAGWCGRVPVVNDLAHKYAIYHKCHNICCNNCNVSCFLNWSEYSRQSSSKQQRDGHCRQLTRAAIAVVSHYLYKLWDHNHKKMQDY